ncbi:unnamed protein product [Psylliodes chrysocephalus]|uniref:Uncharacterized protein n=1 Tax=Psylliodes chrysocephalus TaxID=3402493 RepID=A0A9P0CC67_9CUCU|nr:unnamed protein product [Psylliodes chrysocephala]
MFCQFPASIEKKKRKSSLVKKRTIVFVSNTEFKTTLLNQITAHIDIEKYKAMLEIISGIDLTVFGARYHEVCRLPFYRLSEKVSGKAKPKGRPKDSTDWENCCLYYGNWDVPVIQMPNDYTMIYYQTTTNWFDPSSMSPMRSQSKLSSNYRNLSMLHLLQHLDGKTTGPKGFHGKIGKQLEKCETLQPLNFKRIEVILPEINVDELSTDQKYLYEICCAISKGYISLNLSKQSPGKMAYSRWLTTANRILRLYVSTEKPSQNLSIITEYVIKVYAPTWFAIKI